MENTNNTFKEFNGDIANIENSPRFDSKGAKKRQINVVNVICSWLFKTMYILTIMVSIISASAILIMTLYSASFFNFSFKEPIVRYIIASGGVVVTCLLTGAIFMMVEIRNVFKD